MIRDSPDAYDVDSPQEASRIGSRLTQCVWYFILVRTLNSTLGSLRDSVVKVRFEQYLAAKLALNLGETQEVRTEPEPKFRFGVHDLAEPNPKFRFRVQRKGPRTRTEPNFDITTP
ncbi:hypothetical protein FB45DRAFT_863164 [Roridomyces roridus]|uniref:Uncharacterized protein n=1 Tax=Roridomyces roridus TaxID=1738132 RepID=A0AAD7C9E7_9AGAR|nr:hypothetical protein FB45DRAFT_863164 [Roridomyces roridus]